MEIDQQHVSESDIPVQFAEPTPLPASPDNPPWNSWVAVGVWAFSVMMIVFLPAVFLVPYLAYAGVITQDALSLAEFASTNPAAIVVQMLAIIPAHILTLAFAWLVVTRRGQFSFRQTLGWTSGGIRWWHHVLIFLAFFGLAAVVSTLIPESENQLTRILKSSRTAVFVIALMATFTAPLVEEVVYRGVLYSAFQRAAGKVVAVVAVTLIFSLVHVPQYYESLSTVLLLTVLSLILTLMRVYSGSLLPSIIFHTIVNGVQSIALIAEPYVVPPAGEPQAAAVFFLLK